MSFVLTILSFYINLVFVKGCVHLNTFGMQLLLDWFLISSFKSSLYMLQKYQLDRISLHDSKRATYEHTKKSAENLMLLGQTDRAVQLLLETDADNDSYYVDCLRSVLFV